MVKEEEQEEEEMLMIGDEHTYRFHSTIYLKELKKNKYIAYIHYHKNSMENIFWVKDMKLSTGMLFKII
jgi:hypothetical protein